MERIEDRFSEAQCRLFEENSHHESLHLAIPCQIYTKKGTEPTPTQGHEKMALGQPLPRLSCK